MRVLSLFSGGGLGDYGLELAGMEIVGQVEIDDYCQKILNLRWPGVPKWRDIREVKGEEVIGKVRQIDLISGGFPCQDISQANPGGKGIEGKRSGLWKEMFRLIREIRPSFVLVENVPKILSKGLGTVLRDLASVRYDTEWDCISASTFGANHRRERLWLIAHNKDTDVPASESRTLYARQPILQGKFRRSYWWDCEPSVCRVDDGTPNRVDRLKLLGNGQVVQVVEWIGRRILEADRGMR